MRGCGLAERAVALGINGRPKRRGMRWRRASADAEVSRRARWLTGQWTALPTISPWPPNPTS